ncbi:hypothetical protein [Cytobacillus dafuensis]|nr:hypothetical protein [Cytobacillus dafuensis]
MKVLFKAELKLSIENSILLLIGAESERLQRKSTGKFNIALFKKDTE